MAERSHMVTAYSCGVCKDLLDEPATHYQGAPLYEEHRSKALGSAWGVLMMDFAGLEELAHGKAKR